MKTEEATQSIEYSRTIVPSSMRSPYWKYFGFPSDNANNILTKQKIICTLCNTAIAYNKNTSNLRTHLIAKHCELLHELQQQHQQNGSSTPPSMKRTHSDMITQTQPAVATAANCREKKPRDSSYTFATDDTDAYIADDYKRNSHALIVEEDEETDVVELVEHAQAPDELSDADAVDFAEYATVLQTTDADNVQQAQQKKLMEDAADEVEPNPDDSYSFDNVGTLCQKRCIVEKSMIDLELDDLVLDMLITDLLPLSTVEGVGFKSLFNNFGSVDKTTVEQKLSSLHNAMFDKVSAMLKNICQTQTYSFSVEINKNVDNQLVICVYVNYFSAEEHELLSILYQSLMMAEDFLVVKKCVDFEHIFSEFNLSKCAAYVLNEPNSVIEMFFHSHGIPMIPCLESVLRRCISFIFDLSSVKSDFSSVFKRAESFIKANNSLLITLPEVFPQCAWSKLNFLQFINENISFNSFDNSALTDKARDLFEYISPLKISLETIADEPLSLCSLMRPFTQRLLEDHFSAYFAEDDYLNEVKHILTDELTNSVIKNAFLNESTFFDGRFRRDFLEASDVTIIKKAVCERFKPLLNDDADSLSTYIKDEVCMSFNSSSSRKSSLKSFFQRNTQTSHKLKVPMKKDNMEYEFNKYSCEPSLDLEQCPISWWQENAFTYRELKQVADFYMSVPCCVNRLFRSSIVERNEVQNKRFMLRNQNAQKIWYLNYNKKCYDKL